MSDRSYPIWYQVTNCNYKNNPNFGFRETGEVNIKVGSSSSNSHQFVKTEIRKREKVIDGVDCIVFTYSVDDKVVKKAIFHNDNGRASKLIKIEAL